METKNLDIATFYKDVIKTHTRLNQKSIYCILFYGVNWEQDERTINIQPSQVSKYFSGSVSLPKNLCSGIIELSENELETRLGSLGIQDPAACAETAANLVQDSSLSDVTKNSLIGIFHEAEPFHFLGVIFRKAVEFIKPTKVEKNNSLRSSEKTIKRSNSPKENDESKMTAPIAPVSHETSADDVREGAFPDRETSIIELGLSDSLEAIDKRSMEEQLKIYQEQFELYKELGIVGCTNKLKETKLAPLQCMPKVRKSLYFTGVGGEKWVKDEERRRAFSTMLLQTEAAGGEVCFLLIDPACDAYKRLYSLRGNSVPYESYQSFIELKKEHPNLHVRLYDHMPAFRMQFVDDKYVAVSRYYFDKKTHDKMEGGWMIPHLIIYNVEQGYDSEIKYKWSLYESFRLAYRFSWEKARDISEWDKEGRIFKK